MTSTSMIKELSVKELKQLIDTGSAPVILDIREAHEIAIARLPEVERSFHIPLGELPLRLAELTPLKGDEIVVYCRSGGRSMMAANFLVQNGFKAANLKGGILAWSQEIDPKVRQY